jgi:Na+-translocating ferredoxin:NAD+ oxidoreductase subunit B
MPDQETTDSESQRRTAEITPGQINALLPQTQCTQCGFGACLPYAQAISDQRAAINRCPPGGQAGVCRLAKLTGRPEVPLDVSCGLERDRRKAWIDPAHCIGCTLCIEACPVDAIIGAPKALHAVVASLCTGCELCVAPCPVDCIELHALAPPSPWTDHDAAQARRRFEAHNSRRSGIGTELPLQLTPAETNALVKQNIIDAALAKARQRLAARPKTQP